MDWKKSLALAAGAFVAMPAATVATACPNELTARRRLRRRRTSVPVRVVPGVDRSLRVSVNLPLNKARRVPAACDSYQVDAFMKIGDLIFKLDQAVQAGAGATFEFDLQNQLGGPETVSASVEVTPTGVGGCATIQPVASFVLNDADNRHTFLPSIKLEPVHLLPAELGGPIIVGPPGDK